MAAAIFLIGLVVFALLALRYGVDSRYVDPERWWHASNGS
jgi:hypothetical protein